MNPLNSKVAFAFNQGVAAAHTSMFFTANACPYSTPEYAVAWCQGLHQGYVARIPNREDLAGLIVSGGPDKLFYQFAVMVAWHSPLARSSLAIINQMMLMEGRAREVEAMKQ